MNDILIQYHKSKIGELIIGSYKSNLCILDFRYRKMRNTVDNRIKNYFKAGFVEQQDEIISNTILQLDQYLNAERVNFDLPIIMAGTEFQKRVWKSLMNVPYGKTATYFDLAKQIKNTSAVRAVAAANGANSISLIIPCHRIIGSDGKLVGYGGGLATKKKLLHMEYKRSPYNKKVSNLAQESFAF